ncbi:MAG: AarF/UbiB family protein [Candidatus Binatia bacterium]|nr:AarF/UbiB family protein [Candidatus Binatia bacterium]
MNSRSSAWRITRRSAQILRASALGLVAFTRERRALAGDPEASMRALGRALVGLCADLGATFIKVGQIASTRGDLLPRALVSELTTLQDDVPPFAFEDVQRTIESELGRRLDEIFEEFDPTPVAAASVAQVHRGILKDGGDTVAVKVRRPDIVEKASLDRSILLFIGRTLERVIPSVRLMALEEALRAFCDAVQAQIHLENEARNNARFTENFIDDPDVDFPRLYLDACSDAVLTMEFVDGVHESELEATGCDVHAIVTAGMRCVCRMIFLHGFVHADLHPGNMRFQHPSHVVLLDLGLTGEINDEDRITTAQTLFALATGDGKTVARLFHENAPHTATPDYDAYEREMANFVGSLQDQGLQNVQITAEIGRIFDILRRHRVQARSHMTMVNIALMTAEGLGKRLAPELSLTHEALPYLQEALMAGQLQPGGDRA